MLQSMMLLEIHVCDDVQAYDVYDICCYVHLLRVLSTTYIVLRRPQSRYAVRYCTVLGYATLVLLVPPRTQGPRRHWQ